MILSVAGFRSTSEEASYNHRDKSKPLYPNAGCKWQLQGDNFVRSSARYWPESTSSPVELGYLC